MNGKWACLFGVLAVAGCGGHERIDKGVAERLAQRADAVAVSLERSDGCAATRDARALHVEVRSAIRRGEIPARLRQPLRTAAASLESRIVCTPPAVAPPPPPAPVEHGDKDGHGHGKAKGHGKGHGKGEG